ncbi:MAG TPA: DUF308 domain-containing protein [Acidimicrobiia bacterium]|nr:DUF308 domain-containing protein [Acidimicrobiia bacterium]
MAATMTASQRRAMDEISDVAGRAAWVYLAAGILSVLFGAVVLSLVLDWVGLYTVALFVGIFLIAWGALHLLGALIDRPAHWVWHLIGGALSIAAGALAIAWPDVTLFVLVVIIGWALIVWGILDLLSAFATYGMRHWWLYLIRGIASIALGFLALGRENVTLYFVVTLLGAFVILWGLGDILIAFLLHGAKAKWHREERAMRTASSNAGSRPAASRTTTARKAAARKPARKSPARTASKR